MNLYESIKLNVKESEEDWEDIEDIEEPEADYGEGIPDEPYDRYIDDVLTMDYDELVEKYGKALADKKWQWFNKDGSPKDDNSINESEETFSVVMTIEKEPGVFETKIYDTYDSQEQASDKAGELRAQGINCKVVSNYNEDIKEAYDLYADRKSEKVTEGESYKIGYDEIMRSFPDVEYNEPTVKIKIHDVDLLKRIDTAASGNTREIHTVVADVTPDVEFYGLAEPVTIPATYTVEENELEFNPESVITYDPDNEEASEELLFSMINLVEDVLVEYANKALH